MKEQAKTEGKYKKRAAPPHAYFVESVFAQKVIFPCPCTICTSFISNLIIHIYIHFFLRNS